MMAMVAGCNTASCIHNEEFDCKKDIISLDDCYECEDYEPNEEVSKLADELAEAEEEETQKNETEVE